MLKIQVWHKGRQRTGAIEVSKNEDKLGSGGC